MTRLVLFDIDGTILLSAGAGRRAIVAAMAHAYGACDAWETVRFDGKTDPQILMELAAAAGHDSTLPPERLAELGRSYLSHLERELSVPGHRSTVLPGIPELLDQVEATEGAVLGLLTGNFVEGAGLKLRSAGIDPDRFRVGAYGSDSAVRAELPPVAATRSRPHFGRIPHGHDVVIVGDTPSDVTCGLSIGARAIGVATGFYSVAELEAAGAVVAFETLSETDAVLEAIFG
ncbi:MAG: HAD hydrolase-like protein [Gemmatimonadota bacterium]